MDNTTTVINATPAERVELIMNRVRTEQCQWHRSMPASVAMINKRSFLADQDKDASTLAMGGLYAIDGTFPTRWGSRPRPPV